MTPGCYLSVLSPSSAPGGGGGGWENREVLWSGVKR
jgi:hypothetical protein